MTRHSRLLLLAALSAVPFAAGCHVYEDRVEVFPRLRHALTGQGSTCSSPAADRRSADPASRAGIPYGGAPGYATPVGLSGGYDYPLPGGAVSGPIFTGDPYPQGPGTPVPGGAYPTYPRGADELPPPGGYAQPRTIDQGRGAPVQPIAPKPSVLATSDLKK